MTERTTYWNDNVASTSRESRKMHIMEEETQAKSEKSFSGVVCVSCFGVRVSVMFQFMFVHYTFGSVWVAEWPHFGK